MKNIIPRICCPSSKNQSCLGQCSTLRMHQLLSSVLATYIKKLRLSHNHSKHFAFNANQQLLIDQIKPSNSALTHGCCRPGKVWTFMVRKVKRCRKSVVLDQISFKNILYEASMEAAFCSSYRKGHRWMHREESGRERTSTW